MPGTQVAPLWGVGAQTLLTARDLPCPLCHQQGLLDLLPARGSGCPVARACPTLPVDMC